MSGEYGPSRDCEIYKGRKFVEHLVVPPGHGVRLMTLYDAAWDQAIILYDEESMEVAWSTGSREGMGGEIADRLPRNSSAGSRSYLITGWHQQPGTHWDQSRRRTHFKLPNCGFMVVGFEDGRDMDYKDAILVCHITDEDQNAGA